MMQVLKRTSMSAAIMSLLIIFPLSVSTLSLLTLSAPSFAQNQEERFTLNMREADIRAFIQWVADRTGRSMIVHKNVQGNVTVLSQAEVTSDEAYELFLTILEVHGYTAVDTGTAIKVIPDTDAKSATTPLAEQLKQAGSEPVTGILRVDNVDAAQMVGLLRPLIPASGHIAAFPKTNALIITDSAANLNRIRGIVKKLDKSGEIDIEIVKLEHASANDIVNTLKALVPKGSISADSNAASIEVSFAVDERSNAILMTGDSIKRAHLKRIIRRLDTPLDGDGNTQVVYLNYIDAAEVVPILKSVGDSMLKDTKKDQKNFSIEQSEATNALVISAPPALLNNLLSIISQLDIRRAQVLVEAIVVQVSYDDDEDMGVIWGTANIVGRDNPDGSFATVNGLSAGASLTLPSSDSADDISQALFANSGLTFGYLKDGDLLAAIRAIGTERVTNIMSTPTVVALDNEEASLLVGQNVPFITGSAATAASDTSNPFTTIQRQDVGITLNVTPRINQGDSITLEITQSTENVVQDATSVGAADIITEKTEIKTSALVRDGEVLVVGGLIRDDEVQNRTQVPFLGSLPIVGRMFRSDSTQQVKNNLMVFIRPVILKDQLQVEGITRQRYAFMREKQLQAAMQEFIIDNTPPLLDEFETLTPQKMINEGR